MAASYNSSVLVVRVLLNANFRLAQTLKAQSQISWNLGLLCDDSLTSKRNAGGVGVPNTKPFIIRESRSPHLHGVAARRE